MAGLTRFLEAQENDYQGAFAEIKRGRKQSHWMWYIFPQIEGLGFSETSKYYAIRDVKEAEGFLTHPVLGGRLIRICQQLLKLESNNATDIFGTPDDLKLKSCMTLFAALPNTDPVFQQVLDKFYSGVKDVQTMHLINTAQA
ncbi:DUF1810 domain-containing protein [Mucilaginibacter sp.]|jgi:uncharacterized protein (DUF1810 family)|uniref:DUF1810 domain-containing protein n=1 Tax=Mucilaginibacter sp. TaxID=1882438 RepID=UPI00356A7784